MEKLFGNGKSQQPSMGFDLEFMMMGMWLDMIVMAVKQKKEGGG